MAATLSFHNLWEFDTVTPAAHCLLKVTQLLSAKADRLGSGGLAVA
jgi:hypothetical protein